MSFKHLTTLLPTMQSLESKHPAQTLPQIAEPLTGPSPPPPVVDAALSSSVPLFIWSALESLSSLTDGKYPNCAFYETKAEITRYLQASGQAHALVQPACYFSNLLVSVPLLFSMSLGGYG